MRPQQQIKEIDVTAIEAFAPVILNQMIFTALLIVVFAAVANTHNILKKIRGRYGRLRYSPRLALAYIQR